MKSALDILLRVEEPLSNPPIEQGWECVVRDSPSIVWIYEFGTDDSFSRIVSLLPKLLRGVIAGKRTLHLRYWLDAEGSDTFKEGFNISPIQMCILHKTKTCLEFRIDDCFCRKKYLA